jgi:uncharacterized protein YbjT (DUF2867 family)
MQRTFIDTVTRVGVQHVVRFSGIGCEPGSPFRFARAHGEAERTWKHRAWRGHTLRPSQAFGIRPTTFAEFAHRHAAVVRGDVSPSLLWPSGWQPPARQAPPLWCGTGPGSHATRLAVRSSEVDER